MPTVFISIGSNINRDENISAGIEALKSKYSPILCSPIYESVAVGFEGENFYNLVVSFSTSDALDAVCKTLSTIEDNNGRDRSGPKFGPRTLDLDLLLYGDLVINSPITLPRPEIYQNAFVLKPLADISGDFIDPVRKDTYSTLWSMFKQTKQQKLWPISLAVYS